MAAVQLSDVYVPLVFNRLMQEQSVIKNQFIQSGVLVNDPLLANMVSGGGRIGELAGFNALTKGTPNISSDNPATIAATKKIGSAVQKFRVADRNDAWSTMDLARQLSLIDPVGAITGSIGGYWANDMQKRTVSTLLGVMNDSVANFGGDMVVDVSNDVAGAPTVAEKISAVNVLAAKQTLGDAADMLDTISMPSAIYTELQTQDLISFIQTSVTDVRIPRYLNYDVIVDDSLPAVAGANRIKYTVVLAARGALGTAPGNVVHPSELDRVALAGNGAGQDIIISRRSDIIHPYGMSYVGTPADAGAATYAELELAAGWNRVWDRKNIPLAFLQVNQ